ncbi:MAG: flagellar export chaperone FliS [Phycisphaerae bacterium]|nr:flagellar export chaperone FliS [Phycisphaerae bacterium]
MAATGINAYQNNAVVTQTPGRIVVLLYEGAIRFLKEAVAALEKGDFARKGERIRRAQDILMELDCALDMEAGDGEVSRNLRQLYLFMDRQLNTANVKKDAEIIRKVVGMLENLHEGWDKITR